MHRPAALSAPLPARTQAAIPPEAAARDRSARVANNIITAIGLACILTSPAWAYQLFFDFENQPASDFALVPLIIAANVVLVIVLSRDDRFLRRALPVALAFKIVCAAAYLFMCFHVFGGAVDLAHYFSMGQQIAESFRLRSEWEFLHPFWSNNFVFMMTGAMFIVIGPSIVAGSILYAMVSFWGQYVFYRAFCLAFPDGDRTTAGLLLLFLPSVVFWPSTIGKDSPIFYCIAVTTYGFVLLQQKAKASAFLIMAVGLGGTCIIRPHIAAMLAIAILIPYLIGRNVKGISQVAGKMIALPLLVVGIYYIASQAQSFLKVEDLSKAESVVQRVASSSSIGGSQFEGGSSMLFDLLNAPFLLFRPFPWEIRSLQAAIGGMESLIVLALVWTRRKVLRSALLLSRQNAILMFIGIYTVEFSIVFAAAIRNFGLLARQRVMLVPLVMMALCFRSPGEAESPARPARRGGRWFSRLRPRGVTS